MRWAGRPSLGLLLSIAALGCEPPPPPGAPPESSFPPLETAASCPPVLRFAHDWFYFADLRSGRSCTAFLEQDECVLAIFDDCSVRDPGMARQWEGLLSPDRRVELTPVSRNASLTTSGTCRGELDESSPPWVTLSCPTARPAHPGLGLERVLPGAAPFGRLEPSTRIAAGGGSASLRDLLLVENGSQPELWALVQGGTGENGNGVVILDLSSREIVARIAVEDGVRMDYAPAAAQVVIGAKSSLSVVGVGTRQVRAHAFASPRSISALGLSLDAQTVAIAYEGSGALESFVESYDLASFDMVGGPLRLASRVGALTGSPSVQDGASFVAFAHNSVDEESVAVLLSRSLEEIRSYELLGPVFDAELNLRDGRIGFVSSNWFQELAPDDPEAVLSPPVAVPYVEGLSALAYDLDRDRVYVAGIEAQRPSGKLVYIDHAKGRAVQATVTLPAPVGVLRIDRGSGRVLAADPENVAIETVSGS